MKTIKVKDTGVVTTVSDEYYETYAKDGWFIEVAEAPKKPVAKPAKKE